MAVGGSSTNDVEKQGKRLLGGLGLKAKLALAVAAVSILGCGGYFAYQAYAVEPPAVVAAKAERNDAAISNLAPSAVSTVPPVRAEDYEIVSVFDGEAILATSRTLVRVKVGSHAEGLGTITSIESTGDNQGVVVGTEATLRNV